MFVCGAGARVGGRRVLCVRRSGVEAETAATDRRTDRSGVSVA